MAFGQPVLDLLKPQQQNATSGGRFGGTRYAVGQMSKMAKGLRGILFWITKYAIGLTMFRPY